MKKIFVLASLIFVCSASQAFDLRSLLSGKSTKSSATETPTSRTVEQPSTAPVPTATPISTASADDEVLAQAKTYGSNAGVALKSLYTSYKANGNKLDAKDLTTYTSLLQIVANCKDLRENYNNTSYMTKYGMGLVEGSLGLVNETNQGSAVDALTSIANATVSADKVTGATKAASLLTNLFGTLK